MGDIEAESEIMIDFGTSRKFNEGPLSLEVLLELFRKYNRNDSLSNLFTATNTSQQSKGCEIYQNANMISAKFSNHRQFMKWGSKPIISSCDDWLPADQNASPNSNSWTVWNSSYPRFQRNDTGCLSEENRESEHQSDNHIDYLEAQKYKHGEYVREWLDRRTAWTPRVEEPLVHLWYSEEPPAFVLTISYAEKRQLFVELLAVLRTCKTICVVTAQQEVRRVAAVLRAEGFVFENLSSDEQKCQQFTGRNRLFLTCQPQTVKIAMACVINFDFYRNGEEFVNRSKLLEANGHMVTFFDPYRDSPYLQKLIEEMRNGNIEVPTFLSSRT